MQMIAVLLVILGVVHYTTLIAAGPVGLDCHCICDVIETDGIITPMELGVVSLVNILHSDGVCLTACRSHFPLCELQMNSQMETAYKAA